MKIESVLEMNLNPQCASGALLPQPQLLCGSHAASATVISRPEKKRTASHRQTSSLNALVREELTGGESRFAIAEKISFAMLLAITAGATVYLMATVDQFVTALPHFSQFVQGCL